MCRVTNATQIVVAASTEQIPTKNAVVPVPIASAVAPANELTMPPIRPTPTAAPTPLARQTVGETYAASVYRPTCTPSAATPVTSIIDNSGAMLDSPLLALITPPSA